MERPLLSLSLPQSIRLFFASPITMGRAAGARREGVSQNRHPRRSARGREVGRMMHVQNPPQDECGDRRALPFDASLKPKCGGKMLRSAASLWPASTSPGTSQAGRGSRRRSAIIAEFGKVEVTIPRRKGGRKRETFYSGNSNHSSSLSSSLLGAGTAPYPPTSFVSTWRLLCDWLLRCVASPDADSAPSPCSCTVVAGKREGESGISIWPLPQVISLERRSNYFFNLCEGKKRNKEEESLSSARTPGSRSALSARRGGKGK